MIRLEARLQPNIGFTLRRVLAVFMRSAITRQLLAQTMKLFYSNLLRIHLDQLNRLKLRIDVLTHITAEHSFLTT